MTARERVNASVHFFHNLLLPSMARGTRSQPSQSQPAPTQTQRRRRRQDDDEDDEDGGYGNMDVDGEGNDEVRTSLSRF
jgi:hypothetical protein